MPGDNSAVAEAPKGMDKLLKDMNLNFFEFAILSAFWVGVIIVSSFISLEGVLSARARRTNAPWAYAYPFFMRRALTRHRCIPRRLPSYRYGAQPHLDWRIVCPRRLLRAWSARDAVHVFQAPPVRGQGRVHRVQEDHAQKVSGVGTRVTWPQAPPPAECATIECPATASVRPCCSVVRPPREARPGRLRLLIRACLADARRLSARVSASAGEVAEKCCFIRTEFENIDRAREMSTIVSHRATSRAHAISWDHARAGHKISSARTRAL